MSPRPALVFAWVVAALATPVMADRPRIESLEARRGEGDVTVSFRLEGLVDEELFEALASGVRAEHAHRIEVLGRRPLPLWPARVHARMYIDTSASYDSLTERYELTRTVRLGTRKKRKLEPRFERSLQTDSRDEVRAWLTRFDELPSLPLDSVPPDARLRVHVESTLGRRFVLWIFPARITVDADLRLEP